ncbi:hypothetical protein C8J57DRAFT_1237389 [Mycena rebaudengoi]|nr:hypothetical protein C8J57DRAFT_1237389 [Mycena rebaudengoi]
MPPTATLPLGRLLCDALPHPESEDQGYYGCRPTFYFADSNCTPDIVSRSDDGRFAFYSLTTAGGFSGIAADCYNRDRIKRVHRDATVAKHDTFDDARMACDLACRQTHTACHRKVSNNIWRADQREARDRAKAAMSAAARATAIEDGEKASKQVKEWLDVQFMDSEANTLFLDPKIRWFVVGGEHIVALEDDRAPAPSTVVADTFAEALDLACDEYWFKRREIWLVLKGIMTQSIPIILIAYARARQTCGSRNAVIHICGDQPAAERRLHLLQGAVI